MMMLTFTVLFRLAAATFLVQSGIPPIAEVIHLLSPPDGTGDTPAHARPDGRSIVILRPRLRASFNGFSFIEQSHLSGPLCRVVGDLLRNKRDAFEVVFLHLPLIVLFVHDGVDTLVDDSVQIGSPGGGPAFQTPKGLILPTGLAVFHS
jgi:hypothetical protein